MLWWLYFLFLFCLFLLVLSFAKFLTCFLSGCWYLLSLRFVRWDWDLGTGKGKEERGNLKEEEGGGLGRGSSVVEGREGGEGM